MLKYSEYREFWDEAEAETWAREHYGTLLELPFESEVYKDFFAYTGNWSVPVNNIMRLLPPYGTPEFFECDPGEYQEAYDTIPRIVDVLNQYELPESIVVYRFTHLKMIRDLYGVRHLRTGQVFSDKAFLSTTLLRKQLVPFGRSRRCDCVLKLYLPKGMHGAYVSSQDERDVLREYEFLLPPNITFKIVKVHRLMYPKEIECVVQEN